MFVTPTRFPPLAADTEIIHKSNSCLIFVKFFIAENVCNNFQLQSSCVKQSSRRPKDLFLSSLCGKSGVWLIPAGLVLGEQRQETVGGLSLDTMSFRPGWATKSDLPQNNKCVFLSLWRHKPSPHSGYILRALGKYRGLDEAVP